MAHTSTFDTLAYPANSGAVWTVYQFDQANPNNCLPHNFVTSIAIDKNPTNGAYNKWIGTYGGLGLFNEKGLIPPF